MVSAPMRVTLVALLAGVAAVVGSACGGDVVVDGRPTGATGSGGNGAGSSSGSDDDGSSDGDGDDGSSDADGGPSPSSGPGPGTGPAGPGSGGAGPGSCEDCFASAAAGPICGPSVDKCFGDPECLELFTCHGDCQFDLQCMSSCDAGHPGAVDAVYVALGCVVCSECFAECQSTPLQSYCLLQ